MKIRTMGGILFLIVTAAAPAFGAGESSAIFQKANAAYRGGDYAAAVSGYESLIKEGVSDASLHYNLGNAYFKQNRLGPALLHYEKALRLNPRNSDIRYNLRYANGLVTYRMEEKQNWYVKASGSLLGPFTFTELGVATLFFGIFFWISWISTLFGGANRALESTRKVFMTLAGCVLALWVLKGTTAGAFREAVVLRQDAAVRYGPSHKDQAALKLAEGMKVCLQKKSGGWYRARLSNGETGWIEESDLGVV